METLLIIAVVSQFAFSAFILKELLAFKREALKQIDRDTLNRAHYVLARTDRFLSKVVSMIAVIHEGGPLNFETVTNKSAELAEAVKPPSMADQIEENTDAK